MDVAAGHTAGPQHSQRHAHPRLWLTFEGPPGPFLADANKETLSQTQTRRRSHRWETAHHPLSSWRR